MLQQCCQYGCIAITNYMQTTSGSLVSESVSKGWTFSRTPLHCYRFGVHVATPSPYFCGTNGVLSVSFVPLCLLLAHASTGELSHLSPHFAYHHCSGLHLGIAPLSVSLCTWLDSLWFTIQDRHWASTMVCLHTSSSSSFLLFAVMQLVYSVPLHLDMNCGLEGGMTGVSVC